MLQEEAIRLGGSGDQLHEGAGSGGFLALSPPLHHFLQMKPLESLLGAEIVREGVKEEVDEVTEAVRNGVEGVRESVRGVEDVGEGAEGVRRGVKGVRGYM